MSKQTGFTLVELMVSLAIVGILIATAVPTYQTWRQRAYGKEAELMARQILDGEILYYLEHNDFFPGGASTIIYIPDPDSAATTQENIENVAKWLNITIPIDHKLEYQFYKYIYDDVDYIQIMISAPFALFKDGKTKLFATTSSEGNFTIFGG